MRRVLFLTMLVVLLLAACGDGDRPEGVVERWLISLNQGRAGEPEKYASDALSQQVLPNWQKRDPGDLDVIEVGRGKRSSSGPRLPPGRRYLVPFRVERLEGPEILGTVRLVSPHSEPWEIEDLLAPDPTLRVPSEGGERIGRASTGVWLVSGGVAVFLVLLSVALMSTVGRTTRVSG